MTTLAELRAIVADIEPKAEAVQLMAARLMSMVRRVSQQIGVDNPYASTVDVDALIAIQTPFYVAALTALEQACDALSTDGLA